MPTEPAAGAAALPATQRRRRRGRCLRACSAPSSNGTISPFTGCLGPCVRPNLLSERRCDGGLLASYGAFAVGFLIRPIAASFSAISATATAEAGAGRDVVDDGISTTAIGLLPTYSAVGVWAPVLLVASGWCRASARREFAGAILFASEYAPAAGAACSAPSRRRR